MKRLRRAIDERQGYHYSDRTKKSRITWNFTGRVIMDHQWRTGKGSEENEKFIKIWEKQQE